MKHKKLTYKQREERGCTKIGRLRLAIAVSPKDMSLRKFFRIALSENRQRVASEFARIKRESNATSQK